MHHLHAWRVSGLALGVVLFALWIRDIFNGQIGTQAQWLLTLMGATCAVTLLFYRWRDQ